MPTPLLAERVRRDVDVVSRAGLDLETFLEEAVESVGRAVPSVGACLGTHDPATFLLTSARKYGALRDTNTHDHEFGLIEYGTSEPTAFGELARAAVPAAGVHALTGGDVERSGRMSRFMKPHFGFADEMRLVFREAGAAWGALALFRGPDDEPFGTAEIEFMASLTEVFARGVRTGMLCRLSDSEISTAGGGPAVLIIGPDDTVSQMSVGAEGRLLELSSGDAGGDPAGMIASLLGAARRLARGETASVPRSRIRTASGTWLVLHAAPLSAAGDRGVGDVVITIEEARPPEIVSLVVAAFDLTPTRARRHPAGAPRARHQGDRGLAARLAVDRAGPPQDGVPQGRRAQPPRADLAGLLRPVRPAHGRRAEPVGVVQLGGPGAAGGYSFGVREMLIELMQ